MERGNEGDELLFLSLKSVLPPKSLIHNINSFEEISAEILVDTVVHILIVLQSSGLVAFKIDVDKDPLIIYIAGGGNLPSNIASRHRICTAIAAKVKECGYLSDCGYNQLLYPMENQTRTLLTWFSEKLSSVRSSEEVDETADNELPANASINKRIKFAINKWKSAPHLVPISLTGIPPKNIHSSRPFRTLSVDNGVEQYSSMIGILNKCKDQKIPCDSSIFEKHAFDLLYESQPNLVRSPNLLHSTTAVYMAIVRKAAAGTALSAPQRDPLTPPSSTDGTLSQASEVPEASTTTTTTTPTTTPTTTTTITPTTTPATTTTTTTTTKPATKKSLQELIKAIIVDAENESPGSAAAGSYRGRFSLTTEFKQEFTFTTKITSSYTTTSSSHSHISQPLPTGAVNPVEPATHLPAGDGVKIELLSGEIAEGMPALTEAEALLAARQAQQEREEAARQQELEDLKAEVDNLTAAVEEGEHNLTQTQNRVRQLEVEAVAVNEEANKLEKEISLKRTTMEMLPSAKTHLADLRDKSASIVSHLDGLARQWDAVRLPLETEVREKTRRRDGRRQRAAELVAESRAVKAETADMLQDLKEKQGKIQELSEEMVKLPRNLNRLVYTHRILEITASIAKQNEGISKITTDIMDLKKTIGANTSILQRADAVCEELVFAAASHTSTSGSKASGFLNNLKAAGLLSSSSASSASSSSLALENAAVLDTYRKLTALRSNFDELISVVGKIGQQEAAARDLETKIDQETARISVNNFQRIQSDLLAIRQENNQLLEKVRMLGVGGT